jgi:hypothetical protein
MLFISSKVMVSSKFHKTFTSASKNLTITELAKKIVFDNKKQSVFTATNRMNYFVRRGQKMSIETKMRIRFTKRALTNTTNIRNTNKDHTKKIASRFNAFFIHATPFIALKIRRIRRGKRTVHKVTTLNRIQGQRKSFIAFSSLVRTSGRSKKPLRHRVEHELDTLFSSATNPHKGGGLSQTNNSSFFEKRELLYKTAYSARSSVDRKQSNKLKVVDLNTSDKNEPINTTFGGPKSL